MMDYADMVRRILNSEYGRSWIRDREAEREGEVKFYGRELTEEEWKENLVESFLEEPLELIVKVLPEVWEEIKEQVDEKLHSEVLRSPGDLEDSVAGGAFTGHVKVLWDMSDYFEGLKKNLRKAIRV
jgi:hypothetical protein